MCVTIYRACWYGFAYMKETFPVFLFLKLLNLLLLLIFSCLIIKPAVVLLFIRCIIHFIISVYLMYHIILIDWINERLRTWLGKAMNINIAYNTSHANYQRPCTCVYLCRVTHLSGREITSVLSYKYKPTYFHSETPTVKDSSERPWPTQNEIINYDVN